MKHYKINEYLSLKMENGETFVYVNGIKFIQCLSLVLQIPIDHVREFDQVNSIDEAVDVSKHLYLNQIIEEPTARLAYDQNHSITEEEEFIGHCSNIQAWAENQYDTRILHSNIAFPLLKELTISGDPIARSVFKEEIATRFKSGGLSVIALLLNGNYLSYLNEEERDVLFQDFIFNTNYIDELKRAFHLLKTLWDMGDSIAKKVLKEAIKKYLERGDETIVTFLLNGNYLSYLNEEEWDVLFRDVNIVKKIFVEEIRKYLERGNSTTMTFLLNGNYLCYLNEEEWDVLFQDVNFSSFKGKERERMFPLLKKLVVWEVQLLIEYSIKKSERIFGRGMRNFFNNS